MSETQDVMVIESTCTHPELGMTWDLLDNRIYQCAACKKRIVIPMFQASLSVPSQQEAQENFGGMIELAFGPTWGKVAREGRI